MNITMGDLILVVIQSIAIASFAGLAFYCCSHGLPNAWPGPRETRYIPNT